MYVLERLWFLNIKSSNDWTISIVRRFQNHKYPFTARMLEEMFHRKSVRGIYSSNLKKNL